MKIFILPAVAFALFLGCSNPADNVSAAKVTAKPSASSPDSASPQPSTPAAKRLAFGPDTSKIEFIGSKVTGSHHGGFKKFDGELLLDKQGRLLGSGNKVVIDTTSLWADNDRLTGHLKSPDFFDVATYPTATFTSTAIAQQGPNPTVTGTLTLHGVTKEISFPIQIQTSDRSADLQAEFSINRYDFEMKYPGKADDLIRKEVVIKLNLKATDSPEKQTASR